MNMEEKIKEVLDQMNQWQNEIAEAELTKDQYLDAVKLSQVLQRARVEMNEYENKKRFG